MTGESITKGLGGKYLSNSGMARCPAHEDRNPSLSIREQGGKILFHCHAGCSQTAVLAALKDAGLWESEQEQQHNHGQIIAEYSYADEHGKERYQVLRLEPKSFRQRYHDGRGWVWKKHPQQILYRLPEVLEAPIVFVTEGEKDTETLREHGFVATTNSGGAKAPWLPQYTTALQGREVIIVPDADEPGRKRGALIARALLGHAAKITVLQLEDGDGKDISDWFHCGHSELELIAYVEAEAVKQ